MVELQAVDKAIETCNEHLETTSAFGTEIEAYLTRYLLVLIHSCFEQEIKHKLLDRISLMTGGELQLFTENCLRGLLRSIKISELCGFLAKLDQRFIERFRSKVKAGSKTETYYSNIIVNRDATSHDEPPNMTFKELVSTYKQARKVLDAMQYALTAT